MKLKAPEPLAWLTLLGFRRQEYVEHLSNGSEIEVNHYILDDSAVWWHYAILHYPSLGKMPIYCVKRWSQDKNNWRTNNYKTEAGLRRAVAKHLEGNK